VERRALEAAEKPVQAVILSADSMSLRLATVHENSLDSNNPCVFNKTTGYFHGSEGSVFEFSRPQILRRLLAPQYDSSDEFFRKLFLARQVPP
jgi:hypothetical protein